MALSRACVSSAEACRAKPQERQASDRYWRGIVDKATSLDPKDRYENAKQMLQAMDVPYGIRLYPGIPGFRSGELWKQIVASIVYAGCGLCFLVFFLDAVWLTRKHVLREILSAVLVFIASPLLLANAGEWDSRVPGLNRLPVWMRIALRIVVSVLVFILGMELYIGVSSRYTG